MTDPAEITTMAGLRTEIDRLDEQLVALLAARARLIDRAAELKPGEGMPARIEARVEEVVAKVRVASGAAGFDPALAEEIWRRLIEWSIAREEKVLGPS